MESRMDELVEKYWKGETTLDEERVLKEYFRQNPGLSGEAKYFYALNQKQTTQANRRFHHPGRIAHKTRWSVAATVVVGLLAAVLVFRDAGEQRQFVVEDPKEAYEITRKALLMVSSGLNEGKAYSKELKKLNEAEEIIKDE